MSDPLTKPEAAPARLRPKPPPEVRLEGVHKAFGANTVLRGVDLEIRRGDLVAIVGGSGCGKSVLLEHIIGVLRPDKGRVSVADHSRPDAPLRDLHALSEEELDRIRRHWSVVFQRNALFSGSVRENCEFWLRIHTTLSEQRRLERVRESLKAVGFDDPATLMEKQRHELSGGMAKRVAIARAIAMDPAIIFYDEPTTGLDPVLASQIQDLVGKLHHQRDEADATRTSVVITHDKDLLTRLQPRVVMLHEGKVFFDGAFRAFEESPSKIIRPYFELMPGLHLREGRTQSRDQ